MEVCKVKTNIRYGFRLRLLIDVIEYAKLNNNPGLLMFLDFEKAFDSLDWSFIHSCLRKMGFKPTFCKWVKLIYTCPKAFLKINGFLSNKIDIERGIRQGCPLSCLIFIICTEFLALKVKNDMSIAGFEIQNDVNKKEIKITQYADDVCIFLKSIEGVQPCIHLVETFANVSGLKLNVEKTEGLLIGSL